MAKVKRGIGINIQEDERLEIGNLLVLPVKNNFIGDSSGSIGLKSNNKLAYIDNQGTLVEVGQGGGGGGVSFSYVTPTSDGYLDI